MGQNGNYNNIKKTINYHFRILFNQSTFQKPAIPQSCWHEIFCRPDALPVTNQQCQSTEGSKHLPLPADVIPSSVVGNGMPTVCVSVTLYFVCLLARWHKKMSTGLDKTFWVRNTWVCLWQLIFEHPLQVVKVKRKNSPYCTKRA